MSGRTLRQALAGRTSQPGAVPRPIPIRGSDGHLAPDITVAQVPLGTYVAPATAAEAARTPPLDKSPAAPRAAPAHAVPGLALARVEAAVGELHQVANRAAVKAQILGRIEAVARELRALLELVEALP